MAVLMLWLLLAAVSQCLGKQHELAQIRVDQLPIISTQMLLLSLEHATPLSSETIIYRKKILKINSKRLLAYSVS